MAHRTWKTFAPFVREAKRTHAQAGPSRSRTVAALIVGDVLGGLFGATLSASVAHRVGAISEVGDPLLLAFFVALLPAAYAVAGLYPGIGVTRWDELRLLSLYTTGSFIVLAPAAILLREPEMLLLGACMWLGALVAVPIGRTVVRTSVSQAPWWGVPIVVLGGGRAGSALVQRLQADRRSGLRPVAVFDDNPDLLGRLLHDVPVAGTLADSDLFVDDGIRHALVAVPSAESDQLKALIQKHARRFPQLIVVPDFVGLGGADASVCSFEGLIGLRFRQNLLVRHNLVMKRMMDLLLAIPAALVALPIVALAVVAIQSISPGNPFFAQRRVGKGGASFKVWKLRTMYLDAEERLARTLAEDPQAREEWHTKYKLTHDTRILPVVGRFLRVSSLDELPQLWNIVRGQMSFVGPRPFPDYHVEAFDAEFRNLRSEVAPGLTGLWQVTSRSASDLPLQKHLDSLYIANWSPWMDIYILAVTPMAVVRAHGAH